MDVGKPKFRDGDVIIHIYKHLSYFYSTENPIFQVPIVNPTHLSFSSKSSPRHMNFLSIDSPPNVRPWRCFIIFRMSRHFHHRSLNRFSQFRHPNSVCAVCPSHLTAKYRQRKRRQDQEFEYRRYDGDSPRRCLSSTPI